MSDPRAQHKEVHAPLPVQQQQFPGKVSDFSLTSSRYKGIDLIQSWSDVYRDALLWLTFTTAGPHAYSDSPLQRMLDRQWERCNMN